MLASAADPGVHKQRKHEPGIRDLESVGRPRPTLSVSDTDTIHISPQTVWKCLSSELQKSQNAFLAPDFVCCG
jgi:hypothetical protein